MSKSELKNTTALSNAPEITMDALVKAVNAEQAGKDRADFNGNRRRLIALQLATAYPETLSQWRAQVIAWHSQDSEQRKACADWAAAVCGVDELKASDPERRNVVHALINSVTFAVDVIAGNYADDIVFSGKVQFIKGGSRLAHAVWRVLGWTDSKNKSVSVRSPDMDLGLAPRTADKNAGSNVSWAQLGDIIRELSNRKATGRSKAQTVTSNKPVDALKIVSSIAAMPDVPAHFKNGGARIQSIDTAEDILALALTGDECKALRDHFAKAFEQARELVRASAAAAIAAAKGNPEAASAIKATLTKAAA